MNDEVIEEQQEEAPKKEEKKVLAYKAKPKKEPYKPSGPILIKQIAKNPAQAKFYRIAMHYNQDELLGVAAFSLPHQEAKIKAQFEAEFGMKVRLIQPAALKRMSTERVKIIEELLKGILPSEFDRTAYNAALGKAFGSAEISTQVRLG